MDTNKVLICIPTSQRKMIVIILLTKASYEIKGIKQGNQ